MMWKLFPMKILFGMTFDPDFSEELGKIATATAPGKHKLLIYEFSDLLG